MCYYNQADALGSKIGYAKYVVRPKDLTSRFSNVSQSFIIELLLSFRILTNRDLRNRFLTGAYESMSPVSLVLIFQEIETQSDWLNCHKLQAINVLWPSEVCKVTGFPRLSEVPKEDLELLQCIFQLPRRLKRIVTVSRLQNLIISETQHF